MRMTFLGALLTGLALGSPAAARGQAGGQIPDSLVPGVTVDARLAGGQAHRYRLVLERGRFVRVVVEQRGVDVVVALHGPQGDSLASVDSPNGTDGPEPLAIVTAEAGTYILVVSALEPGAGPGAYRATLTESRLALATDGHRVRAERALAAGNLAVLGGTRPTLTAALTLYREALAAWELVGDSVALAQTMLRVADAQTRLGEAQASLTILGRALAIAEGAADTNLQILLLNEAGQAHDALDQPAGAVDRYGRMRLLAQVVGDRAMEGSALSNSAGSWQRLGRRDSAIAALERALLLARERRDPSREAPALNNVGRLYEAAGETERALQAYHRALELTRAIGERNGEMSVLGNLGGIYAYISADDQALYYRQRALDLSRQLGNRRAEATYLNNISNSYENLGDTTRALDYLRQALVLAERLNERGVQARANENLGRLLDRPHQRDTALQHLERALALWREMGDREGEASTLAELAALQATLGRRAEAWPLYERAVSLMRQAGQRTYEARTLRQMAQLAATEGDLARARTLATDNLALVERMRRDVGDRRLRTVFHAMAQSAYTTLVNVLMSQHRQDPAGGYDRLAVAIAERARARGLLDALSDANLDLRRGLDSGLVDRERRLAIRVDSLARALREHIARGEPVTVDGQQRHDAAAAEHQAVRATLRAQNPDHVFLEAEPLGTADMQAALDSQTTLLFYFATADAVYVWSVTRDAVRGYTVADGAALVPRVRRYLELVGTRNRRVPGESAERWRTRLRRAARDLPPLAQQLSRSLLGPVAPALRSRILIVGSGVLQYLPFAALPVPPGAPGAGRPLVTQHEVVGLPSVSTVALLRDARTARPAPTGTVAVIADPVFAADDRRVDLRQEAAVTAAPPQPPAWMAAVRGIAGDGPLPRLVHSRDEALAIAALVPPTARLLALDFDADVALATSDRLRAYRVVHFATHGFVNSDFPELSGVALSMVGRDGARQDGYLRLQQIYALRLPVDLVVLSACQTALGRDIRGEGLVGLTRGFLFAGASRVVATLWKVDDEATAELMTRFYRHLLGPNRRSPAAALRAAQAELMRQPRWRDPYYWAGFTIQGDWTN